MSEFKREVRYTVIKHNQLTESQMQHLKNCIFGEGIPTVEAVVIESDWPEFEPVWRMIEDRVSGAPVEGGKAEYDALAQAMTTNQTINGVLRADLQAVYEELTDWKSPVAQKLRALLDAPAVQWLAMEVNGKPWVIKEGPNAEKWRTMGYDLFPVQPSAQPQGEPVAWRFRWDYDHGNGWCRNAVRFVECMEHVEHEDKSTWRDITPLYAEQPAPVSDGVNWKAVANEQMCEIERLKKIANNYYGLLVDANKHVDELEPVYQFGTNIGRVVTDPGWVDTSEEFYNECKSHGDYYQTRIIYVKQ